MELRTLRNNGGARSVGSCLRAKRKPEVVKCAASSIEEKRMQRMIA